MNEKEMVAILSAALLEKAADAANEGLYDGLTGMCLFLYEYSRSCGKREVEEKANELIERCWDKIAPDGSAHFYQGKAGIIWGIDWLRKQEMLDWEINEPDINETDSIVIRQKYYTPVQIDMESDLFSAGLYLFGRYKAYQSFNEKKGNENTLLYEQFLREHLIYLLEECERIVFNRAYLQPLLLPRPSASIVCSIFYFITLAHKERLYPHKTGLLLGVRSEILRQAPVNDLTDWAMLRSFSNGAYEPATPDSESGAAPEKIISWVAKAGFQSLLYNDISIFDTITAYLSEHKKNEWTEAVNRLRESPHSYPAGMNGLAGWGHGLLHSAYLSKHMK